MADNPRPETSYDYLTQEGRIIRLQSRALHAFLFSLWKRLGGSTDTPDLPDLSAQVNAIDEQLSNQQEQITALSDNLIAGLADLQAQIDALSIPAVQLDEVYSILTDMNNAHAALADFVQGDV